MIVAKCGLNCRDCEARKATLNNDDKLREKVAKEWSELNNITLVPSNINCYGCNGDGVKFGYCNICDIRVCASNKGYNTCGECGEYLTCFKVNKIIGNNESAKSIIDTISNLYKKITLFNEQKELLDTFLKNGAISKEQYDTSLNGLKEKMQIELCFSEYSKYKED